MTTIEITPKSNSPRQCGICHRLIVPMMPRVRCGVKGGAYWKVYFHLYCIRRVKNRKAIEERGKPFNIIINWDYIDRVAKAWTK